MLVTAPCRTYVQPMSETTRLTISLPRDIAAQLDAFARDTDRTVSGVVRFALRPLLSKTASPPASDPCAVPAERAPAGSPVSGGGIGSIVTRSMERSREQAAERSRVADDVREQNRRYLQDLGKSC